MKIDVNTINILKNFAKINLSIIIDEGNIIKTAANNRSCAAEAVVSTNFEKKFAVHNLDKFISVISLFDDPDFEFHENYVLISNGNAKTQFMYCDEESIKKFSTESLKKINSVHASFNLSQNDFKNVEKALGVLGLPEIVFIGDGNQIHIQAANTKDNTSNKFSICIGNTLKNFKAIFKSENIKIIPMDYVVEIVCGEKYNFARFVGNNIQYWIPMEATSEF